MIMFTSLSSGGNSASGISSSTSSLNRIPHDLILLIRIIMRTFYSFELYLCMEMLLIYPCIKEEDLADLLRLDAKVVHQHLLNLKREKFVSERSIMVTSDDGTKMTKHSYFYINYQMMVNVIKYKLDKISNQIESEEKQFTTRPNFKCTHCHKTYSDLDTKDIFLTMRCLHCGSEVEEDVSSMPQRTTRNLMSKFNTQMKIIFDLLKKVDHVKIADDLLRPDPVDMKPILNSIMPGAASNANGQNGTNGKQTNGGKTGKEEIWSGEKTRKTDLLGQTRISINFDSTNGMSSAEKAKKEMPSILALNRRHEEDLYATTSRDSILLEKVKLAAEETSLAANGPMSSLGIENVNKPILNGSSAVNGGLASTKQQSSNNLTNGSSSNLEVVIMQKLLKHEKKAPNTNGTTNDDSTLTKHKRSYNEINSNGDQVKHTNGLSNGSHTHYNHAQRLSNGDEHAESIKKRKLNNGDTIPVNKFARHMNGENHYAHQNGHNGNHHNDLKRYCSSEGSDKSMDYDEYEGEYEHELNGSEDHNDFETDQFDQFIPRLTVQNRTIRLDRITSDTISKMNDLEKENYINICRQLYTEIYDI